MRREGGITGYTLIEVMVALLVFSIAALALAASSALVARAMARNAERERAARVAVRRIEVVKSQCATATTGRETIEQMESDWAVTRDSSMLTVSESVRCLSPRSCAESYHAALWCRA
jgi:prepilin-type N-terminal cleavage/methylation domain-containing protein